MRPLRRVRAWERVRQALLAHMHALKVCHTVCETKKVRQCCAATLTCPLVPRPFCRGPLPHAEEKRSGTARPASLCSPGAAAVIALGVLVAEAVLGLGSGAGPAAGLFSLWAAVEAGGLSGAAGAVAAATGSCRRGKVQGTKELEKVRGAAGRPLSCCVAGNCWGDPCPVVMQGAMWG